MKHRIIVLPHRPWRRWATIGGLAFAIAVGAWGIYRYTRANTISDFERAQSERDRLRAENQRLEKELRLARNEAEKARDDAAYAHRSQEIDAQACAQVKASLTGLQTEAADLREQLAFYRGIVAPDDANIGARVYDFKVTRNTDAPTWKFDLVLIQSVHHERRVGGRIDVTFEGVQGTQRKKLQLADLADADARNLVFSFKYFEEFSGNFRLPDGFRPLRAIVTVTPDGSASQKSESEYDWSKIEQQGLPP